MQRIIIFLIVLPFLFACDSNNTTTKTQSKVKTTVSDSSVNITFDKEDLEDAGIVADTENSTEEEEIQPLTGMISKTGKAEAERGTIEDEDEALKARRARTQFNNGATYYRQGELDKAIDAFKLALEYNPDNSKAFYNLGKIYYDLGQKELSLSYYKDAANLNPHDSLSLLGIGLLYYEKGDFNNAVRYYNKAIVAAPHFSAVYFNRGTMYGQNKKYEKSVEDLTMAIKYDKQNSEAYVNRGLAYFYSKQMDFACKDWNKAAAMGNAKGKKAVGIYCSGEDKEKK